MSDIFVHRNIFDNHAQFVCPLCTEYEEDEVHFILQCPVFHDIRDEPEIIRSLSLFILHLFKKRHEYLYGNIVETL